MKTNKQSKQFANPELLFNSKNEMKNKKKFMIETDELILIGAITLLLFGLFSGVVSGFRQAYTDPNYMTNLIRQENDL